MLASPYPRRAVIAGSFRIEEPPYDRGLGRVPVAPTTATICGRGSTKARALGILRSTCRASRRQVINRPDIVGRDTGARSRTRRASLGSAMGRRVLGPRRGEFSVSSIRRKGGPAMASDSAPRLAQNTGAVPGILLWRSTCFRREFAVMSAARTSLTHPLRIAEVRPSPSHGRIGMTLCPGKHDRFAQTGAWARDWC